MCDNEIIDLVKIAIGIFARSVTEFKNHRYLSWEHCYIKFIEARTFRDLHPIDKENLSLHLAFYLASWGMYRGSSFLLQRDYKIHTPVVEEILSSDYDVLAGINWINQSDVNDAYNCLRNLVNIIKKKYAKVREDITDKDADISDVLITKVLMGTLGCVPAYDRYFTSAIKFLKIKPGTFNTKTMASMNKLIEFYKNHYFKLEEIRKGLQISRRTNILYPQMKIIDMGFWQIGMALDPKIWKNEPSREEYKSDFDFVLERLKKCCDHKFVLPETYDESDM